MPDIKYKVPVRYTAVSLGAFFGTLYLTHGNMWSAMGMAGLGLGCVGVWDEWRGEK
jgi:hypothetical protein